MQFDKILGLVTKELDQARIKHPIWPSDIVHGAAIVSEESGELIRAVLNYVYEQKEESGEEIISEAIQTIVTSIRFLENFKND